MRLRSGFLACMCFLSLAAAPVVAADDDYPRRQIKIIVPFPGGAQEVAHSAPDGYTLLMGTNTTHASNVATLKNPGYDPAKDFSDADSSAIIGAIRPSSGASS